MLIRVDSLMNVPVATHYEVSLAILGDMRGVQKSITEGIGCEGDVLHKVQHQLHKGKAAGAQTRLTIASTSLG